MDLQTWVSIAVLLGTGAAICSLLLKAINKLDTKIDTTREDLDTKMDKRFTALDTKIETTRDELRGDIGKVDTKIEQLDTKVDAKTEGVRGDVTEGFAALRTELQGVRVDVSTLENRVYDLITQREPRTH